MEATGVVGSLSGRAVQGIELKPDATGATGVVPPSGCGFLRIVVQRNLGADDARVLNEGTSIPKLVWFALWLAGTLAAVVIGARWMLHPAVRPASR
jgi:hypothetical protein